MAGIKTALEQTEDCAITENCETETPQLDFVSDKVSLKDVERIKDGCRNTALTSITGSLYARRLPKDEVDYLVKAINKTYCDPPVSDSEVAKLLNDKKKWEQPQTGAVTFPPIVKAITDPAKLPELQPELIQGILRKGAYMALVGASKMGKSFLLIDLAVCIQNGLKWLGFQCAKGRVLYINLEIEQNSFMKRVNMVYQKYEGYEKFDCFDILNLRGYDVGIEQLQEYLDTKEDYDLFIIDPQYKVNAGDENSATEQGAFFNHIDHIATTHTTSVVICHHHSKNNQTSKNAIDRGSGSGVFGRAVDALLDIVAVKDCVPPDDYFKPKALVLTAILRDFPSIEPIGLWWEFPYHHIDNTDEILQEYAKQGGESTTDLKKGMYECIIEGLIQKDGFATLKTFKDATKVAHNTAKKWIKLCGYALSEEKKDSSPLIVKV